MTEENALAEIERLRAEVDRLAGEVATQRCLYREASADRSKRLAALNALPVKIASWGCGCFTAVRARQLIDETLQEAAHDVSP